MPHFANGDTFAGAHNVVGGRTALRRRTSARKFGKLQERGNGALRPADAVTEGIPISMNGFLPYMASRRSGAGKLAPPSISLGAENANTSLQLPPLEGLLIDPENVLYDATLWWRWLLQLLARMGVSTTYPQLFGVWEARFRRNVDVGRCSDLAAFQAFLGHIGLTAGQIAEVVLAGTSRKQHFEAETRCLTGVKKTLGRLAASGVPLYAVVHAPQTSADASQSLERLGLQRLFRGVITSLEMKCAMPSPLAYQRVLERFGLQASRTALVASQSRRLRGAARLGISTVAVNTDGEVTADFSLEEFSDLLRIIPPILRGLRAG